MEEIRPILNLMEGKAGWLTTLITWIAAIKLASSLVEVRLNHWLCDRIDAVAASADQDDDEFLRGLFAKPWYRTTAVLLRFVGLRLPVMADLERALALQNGNKPQPAQPKEHHD